MTPRDPQGPQGSPPMSSQGCPGGPPPSQGLLGVPWRTLGGAMEVTWGALGSSWEALGEARRSSGCDLEFFEKRFSSVTKPSILKLGRLFGETRGAARRAPERLRELREPPRVAWHPASGSPSRPRRSPGPPRLPPQAPPPRSWGPVQRSPPLAPPTLDPGTGLATAPTPPGYDKAPLSTNKHSNKATNI